MPAIHVSHLEKTYQSWKKQPGLIGSVRSLFKREYIDVPAVKDVSFEIQEGEFVAFIGPNGAGKTTTLKMLSGIIWPTSGNASVFGFTPWKRDRIYQQQLGFVMGQKNQLDWDLPAMDTFLLNKEIYKISARDFTKRIHDFGEMLEIEDKFALPVRKLSLGERMKCELINALIHQPRVLFLDEPTIGLDVTAQQVIRDFLKKWNKEHGATVMLTSHAMTDVEDLCKRVLVIQHGSLYFDGELAQLVKRMSQEKRLTLSFRDPIKKKDVQTLGKVEAFDPVKIVLRVPREDVQSVAAKALAEFPILDISIEDLPLEEVIRKVFSESRIPATI